MAAPPAPAVEFDDPPAWALGVAIWVLQGRFGDTGKVGIARAIAQASRQGYASRNLALGRLAEAMDEATPDYGLEGYISLEDIRALIDAEMVPPKTAKAT